MSDLTLRWLAGAYTVHRFSAETALPATILTRAFVSITRSADELSIVAPSTEQIASDSAEAGWALFMVTGTLDFSLTGILSGLAQPLADADISIFAISTFDTDYVMVKAAQKSTAEQVLAQAGFQFV